MSDDLTARVGRIPEIEHPGLDHLWGWAPWRQKAVCAWCGLRRPMTPEEIARYATAKEVRSD